MPRFIEMMGPLDPAAARPIAAPSSLPWAIGPSTTPRRRAQTQNRFAIFCEALKVCAGLSQRRWSRAVRSNVRIGSLPRLRFCLLREAGRYSRVLAKTQIEDAASFLQRRIPTAPSLGIVLGSGLMHLTRLLGGSVDIRYASIPQFPVSRVPGHQGVLHVGRLANKTVACLAGRVHGYEGYSPDHVTFGVRVLAQLGCHTVILTNAAGSVSAQFAPGSLMLIADHLNLTGSKPHGRLARARCPIHQHDQRLRSQTA